MTFLPICAGKTEVRGSVIHERVCAVCVLAALVLAWPAVLPAQIAELDPRIEAQLRDRGSARVVVALDTQQFSLTDPTQRRKQIQGAQTAVLSALPDARVQRFSRAPGFAGRLNREQLEALRADPRVHRIDLDAGGRGGLAQSVPLIGADQLQSLGFRGAGSVVAILDTGFDANHSELAGALTDEACFLDFDGAIDGAGRCPGGSDRQFGAGAATDDQGHGTRVAGIVAARGPVIGPGVAPASQVLAIKVLDDNGPAGTFNFFSELVAALEYILDERPEVDVINLSLGTNQRFTGDCDTDTSFNMLGAEVVAQLNARGTLVVSISQNDGDASTITSPGCLSGVVAVGASDAGDNVWPFSNSSASVDLVAPGVGITTTNRGNRQVTVDGTSFAAPHVSACAAILRSAGVPFGELRQRLTSSPVIVQDTRNGLSFPRLDCLSALQQEFVIGPGVSGTWFETDSPGQGLLVSVLSDDRMLVFWFTYDPDGRPLWLLGDGTFSGGTAELDVIYDPAGPSFGPDFDPDEFVAESWGTFTLRFLSCSEAVFDWASTLTEFGSGQQQLSRLSTTAGLACD